MVKTLDPGMRVALSAIAMLVGVGLQLQQGGLWPAWTYAGLGAVAVALALGLPRVACGGRARRPQVMAMTALMVAASGLAAAGAGFAWAGWRGAQAMADRLPAELEGEDLWLTGVVSGLPQPHALGLRFVFSVQHAQHVGAGAPGAGPPTVPARVSLAWYQRDRSGPDAGQGLPRAGERWRLPVRLKRPHGSFNPHGFDLELWMLERGLGASGYVRNTPASRPLRLGVEPGVPLHRWRQSLRDAVQRQVGPASPRAAGVVAALLVGDQAAIDDGDWQTFRRTGVAHLVSISGLHVTLFAWLAAAIVGLAWRCSPTLMLACPTPQAARVGGLALAAGYAALAGWGVPAQRTVLMLAVVVGLRLLGRRWPWPLSLLSAAVVVVAVDPWALTQPGFWLSFAAVGLLMAFAWRETGSGAGRRGWRALADGGRNLLRTQAVVGLGLAPLTLLFFQQWSVVGLLANLIAIPLVAWLVTPLALLGAVSAPCWSLAAHLVEALVVGLELMASWPWAIWTAAASPAWAVGLGLLGAGLLVAPVPPAWRVAGVPMLLPTLWPAPQLPSVGRFELMALDVGQGTAVVVRTSAHALLYDAGPAYATGGDAGARIVAPWLQAAGVRSAALMVLSHGDADHVGGAASVLAAVEVKAVLSSLDQGHPVRRQAQAWPHRPCHDGQRWSWDGVEFQVLHPEAGPAPRAAKPNAMSCVLRVQDAAGRSVLLTGDIEAAQERALVERHGPALRSDAMMAPHHGSKTSSSPALLQVVQPRVVFVQAGYRSRFGHPADEVLARYQALGAAVQRSDRCGAWRWTGEGAGSCARDTGRRYWHHRL